jgi:alkanesulfonate monooxygenase SsuD/methylene tetrahydromethanopterin reductase-like flavin-dependent oxidoreductase (luciferase family)
MKFAIAVTMSRIDPSEDMREALRHGLELVRIAEQGGFEIAWAPEHHTIELTIAPNPFPILAQWAAHTTRIRLGTAVVVAPYWHPIKLAGEAALFDVMSDGRLEFGIGRGAFQYEFDRMANGIDQRVGMKYMQESLPAVLALWAGDYQHQGEFFSFPRSTSVPKPVQKPHPPLWVPCRDPGTFDWALKAGANIMATPLSRPAGEVHALGQKFARMLADNPGVPQPRFMMLRRAHVYEDRADWRTPVQASIAYARYFANLFQNVGGVNNGFAELAPTDTLANPEDYREENVRENLLFGTPDEVIEKLRLYQDSGVDLFCYGVSFDLGRKATVRSLELFIERVMPAFASA